MKEPLLHSVLHPDSRNINMFIYIPSGEIYLYTCSKYIHTNFYDLFFGVKHSTKGC